jgi:ribonuclease J
MYQLVRPKISVPVHGEARHIHEHALFAKSLQVPTAIEPHNGVVINLTAATPGIVGQVESGYLALDGSSLIDTNSGVIRTRRKIRDDGVIVASLVLGKNGQLAAPVMISAPGCLDVEEDTDILADIRAEIAALFTKPKGGGKGKGLEESVRNVLRKIIRDELGKKPVLDVHIHQIG